MTAHSNLGASSASRWMNCPGSNKLIEQCREKLKAEIPTWEVYADCTLSEKQIEKLIAGILNTSSPYAELGSAAHALAEYCLSFNDSPTNWLNTQGPIKDSKGRDVITQEVFIDENMVEAVSIYLDHIQERSKLGGELFVETKFDLSFLHEGMFGTADAALYNPMLGILEIVDYKHGQGVAVSPEKNSQAMFYGLGALTAFDEKMHIDKIILTIVQPRAAGDPIKVWETTPEVLRDFGGELKKAAQATLRKGAKLVSGEWCHFCPARTMCPELKRKSYETAMVVFNDESVPILPDPQSLSFEQLKEVLDFSDIFSAWLKSVEGFALAAAQRGKKIPGYKLVQKRANRRWKFSQEDTVKTLYDNGIRMIDMDLFSEPKLLSPAQMEKKIDKNLVASLTETPDNGTTLALAEDRRPEVAAITAQDVFLVH